MLDIVLAINKESAETAQPRSLARAFAAHKNIVCMNVFDASYQDIDTLPQKREVVARYMSDLKPARTRVT